MPITTVIFDYGCVLSLAPTREDFARLRAALGVDPGFFEKIYWRNREAYDLDAIDAATYWQGMVQAAGTTISPEAILNLPTLDIQVWERPNPVMMEWAGLLRARGLRTAILSNMSRTVGDYLRRTTHWLDPFDPVCFSGELKLAKPGLEIYQACLKAVDAPAGQTLFIDDREDNIAAARAVGMNGIVFRSTEELSADLEPYGLTESFVEAQTRAG